MARFCSNLQRIVFEKFDKSFAVAIMYCLKIYLAANMVNLLSRGSFLMNCLSNYTHGKKLNCTLVA